MYWWLFIISWASDASSDAVRPKVCYRTNISCYFTRSRNCVVPPVSSLLAFLPCLKIMEITGSDVCYLSWERTCKVIKGNISQRYADTAATASSYLESEEQEDIDHHVTYLTQAETALSLNAEHIYISVCWCFSRFLEKHSIIYLIICGKLLVWRIIVLDWQQWFLGKWSPNNIPRQYWSIF